MDEVTSYMPGPGSEMFVGVLPGRPVLMVARLPLPWNEYWGASPIHPLVGLQGG